ncbi:MAG TPA: hypothetical protein VLM18_07570, partial [Croceibacterium sp.]|nr:hypothetical protein [Croceibacterium sp.]
MIVLINPRATRPQNRRFPLSLMAIGAALPAGTSWEVLDENLPDMDVVAEVARLTEHGEGDPVRLFAITAMPGPQLVSAVHVSKALKHAHP